MGRYGAILLVVVVTLAGSVCAWAAQQSDSGSALHPADPVQEIRLGRFVAIFEKTTLGEIRDALGVGTVKHTGDAGQSLYWLCYSLQGRKSDLIPMAKWVGQKIIYLE